MMIIMTIAKYLGGPSIRIEVHVTKLLEGSSSWLKAKFLISVLKVFSSIFLCCSDFDLVEGNIVSFKKEREILLLAHR